MENMEKDATSFNRYSTDPRNKQAPVEQTMRQLFFRVVADHAQMVFKNQTDFKKKNANNKKKTGGKKKKGGGGGGGGGGGSDVDDDDTIDLDNTDGEGEDEDMPESEYLMQENEAPEMDEDARIDRQLRDMMDVGDGKNVNANSLNLDCQLLLEPLFDKLENEPGTDKTSRSLKDRRVIGYRWIYINQSTQKLLSTFARIHKSICLEYARTEVCRVVVTQASNNVL